MSQRKSKSSGKKRRNDQRRALQKRLKQRVRKNLRPQMLIAGHQRDGVKMSEVLEQFVKPYAEYVETEDEYRRLLSTAIIAWNVMLFPEKDRQSRLDHFLGMLPEEVRDEGKKILEELMERKERLFAHNRRMILDFEIADIGERWHLSVVSTAPAL